MFRKRYQPGKAVTPDGLAYLGASLGWLLSDHPKVCYSIKARESIEYRLPKLSHPWIVLSAEPADLLSPSYFGRNRFR